MANKSETKKLKTATVLSFESKLANSDALMMSGNWDDVGKEDAWTPIKIQEKSVRGTISNRFKRTAPELKDPARLDAKLTNANIQTVDSAALPYDADTLKVSFTLRVLGNLATPSACNDPDYQGKLSTVINAYIEENTFSELAKRYAINIANGRFLWRNRVCAKKVEIHVKSGNESMLFNAYSVGLKEFSSPEVNEDEIKMDKLTFIIQQGLWGTDNDFSYLEVDAFVQLGRGQMVYPSQEMVMGGKKLLYQLNNVAAMHSQKIGNALRTIDTWHSEADKVGPIAVEPYGSVTNRGKAYRPPSERNDFYTLLDSWILKDVKPDVEQQHYVMAVLVRGGVFGESGKE